MKTLVIGANGQIGRQFCELAHQAGVPIRAMIRDTAQQAWFQARGIETVLADLEGNFRKAFYGCDQVVFAAGSGPHTGPDKTLMIDLHGALSAIDLAATLGIGRFIMVSAMRADRVLEAPAKLRPYMAAKHAADAHLRASRVPHVILKPGRLTDEAATRRVTTDVAGADDNRISRANVAHVLLEVVRRHDLRQREFSLLDGDTDIAEALR
ncbi:SDR family oxidoreductase [Chromohalobacter israelensis]|uniref:SDR family oxidoreductase n=1 Tax=Chromohalobacter israelensis TaxID=141390 RepID=UPI0005540717|nr:MULTISPECIES: SDR family oxidoreductase [Chromohalobacter]MBZ5875375.1 SDR family oxidoreductase [Chromohalobacter salexigens]MDF9433055.1 SDR family oxidoreductase [Chromohalobacter israelensis]